MNPPKFEIIKTQKDVIVQFVRELLDRTDLQEKIIREKKIPWVEK